MIRRDLPRGAEPPKRWLLISQPDHAKLSFELAQAWASDERELPPELRQEFLEAVLHHDDGWLEWSWQIDPAEQRFYSFTEMPTDQTERIWTDSINACRRRGVLAGWVVASHFVALGERHDEGERSDWLATTETLRGEWLAEWLAKSATHTIELADRCLAQLQAFDWMSLWLCCQCPAQSGDRLIEPLRIGDDATGWPAINFTPRVAADGAFQVEVSPWPFQPSSLELRVTAASIPVDNYDSQAFKSQAEPINLAWQLISEPRP